MNIENFKILISSLPVRQQCFTSKKRTWQKAENKIDWLKEINNSLFNNQETLNISRQDIFDSKELMREKLLKIIYWGYPNGMRGNNFWNIF